MEHNASRYTTFKDIFSCHAIVAAVQRAFKNHIIACWCNFTVKLVDKMEIKIGQLKILQTRRYLIFIRLTAECRNVITL